MTNKTDKKLERLMAIYESAEPVRKMDLYYQHGTTTTLEHSRNVARTSYHINKKYNLHLDDYVLVKCAMLHDLFLYDRHESEFTRMEHCHKHPEIACKNAERYFALSEKEKSIIRTHMWPLNFTHIPKSREALLICATDKYCATMETIHANRLWNFASRKKQLILHFVK